MNAGTEEGQADDEGVEFIIHDWRYQRICKTSTARHATTNYFAATKGLPFELSPAFFDPTVLSKYKADSDKYTVGDRNIECRGAWGLRAYGTNDAGQVFAYLCYLRDIPLEEQRYWQLHNEEPRAGLPKAVITSDFHGDVPDATPPQEMRYVLEQWDYHNVTWWKRGDEGIRENTTVPRTNTRDEWGRAIQNAARLIVEGFRMSEIRHQLRTRGIDFDEREQSIALLERLCMVHKSDNGPGFAGLREMQRLRSEGGYSHRRSGGGRPVANAVLTEHGSYATHYEVVCGRVTGELKIIQETFEG